MHGNDLMTLSAMEFALGLGQGCVMTATTWSKRLFDIDQMRQIRYPLPAESISAETAGEIVKIVETAIPVMSAGESPFYQVFPKGRPKTLLTSIGPSLNTKRE